MTRSGQRRCALLCFLVHVTDKGARPKAVDLVTLADGKSSSVRRLRSS
jgi:hypothetical protein